MWPTATTRNSARRPGSSHSAKCSSSSVFLRHTIKRKAPPDCPGGAWKTSRSSERKLRRELNTAGRTATQEGVADAHVAGGRNLIAAVSDFAVVRSLHKPAGACLVNVGSRVSDKRRQYRVGEVGMVQDVEEIGAQLHRHALGDGRVLVDSQVPLLVGRTDQRVPAQVSIMSRARNTIRGASRELACGFDAGHGE